jgi:hypothetical protein
VKSPAPKRGAIQGVANIVRFNWPVFVVAGTVIAVALFASAFGPLPPPLRILSALLAVGTFTQTMLSLGASHWAYDRSNLYDLSWITHHLPRSPRAIANISAGFDESTPLLRELFPSAEFRVFDFYDPQVATEPSIVRARRIYPLSSETEVVAVDSLPLPDASQDLILLFLAAHEIRAEADRTAFFREISRSMNASGRVIVVEHLRDLPNFLVYGPGFLHFLPRSAWARAIRAADLSVTAEFAITPFIRVFVCSHHS